MKQAAVVRPQAPPLHLKTPAAWTTRPRTDSMKSVRHNRETAGEATTTLPDGITTCGSPAGHSMEAVAPATALAL